MKHTSTKHMAYYVMWVSTSQPEEKIRRLQGGRWGGLKAGAFMDGQKLEQVPKLPIVINIFEKDVLGDVPPIFVVPDLVIRDDVKTILVAAGVENINYYPAIIQCQSQGKEWKDYWVCNIIGLVDAIDTKNSTVGADSLPDSEMAVLYDTMVIDETKCQGLKIFRMYSRPSMILVSQQLKDILTAQKFPYVSFILPENFA